DSRQVVIGQFAPLALDLALHLLPVPLDDIPVHLRVSFRFLSSPRKTLARHLLFHRRASRKGPPRAGTGLRTSGLARAGGSANRPVRGGTAPARWPPRRFRAGRAWSPDRSAP